LLAEVDQAYRQLAADYPGWQPYAQAWRSRLAATQTAAEELATMMATEGNL
jgi:hypothetical protein